MKFRARNSERGSLILLVLCLVAVLGIALASYLAVSNQSMKMSNQAYAKDVSRNLAEMGLERAMRSFSYNTFSAWTLSGVTATQTLTTSSSPHVPTSFGSSGITPTVYIRVDHYRDTASNKAVVWSGTTTYASGDFVWYLGVWYLCTSAPTSKQAPSNSTYWTAAPAPWDANATYQIGNVVTYGASAYICVAANANTVPPNATYWTASSVSNWSAATTYVANNVVTSGGILYRCISGNSNQSPPNTALWLSAPVIYSEGVATLNDSAGTTIKTQLRALVAPAALFPNAAGATTLVTLTSGSVGTVDSYNSALGSYNQTTAPFSVGSPNVSYFAVLAGGNTTGTAVNNIAATVKGYVAAPTLTTTPYAIQASFGASSTPSLKNPDGTVTSAHALSPNVDDTRISRSPFIPQFDIQSIGTGTNLPAGAYIGAGTVLIDGAVSLGTSGGPTVIYNITYTHDNPSNTNYAGLDLFNTGQILTINGPVILNVTGLFRINKGSIVIANTGSLEIYFSDQLDIGYTGTGSGGGITNNTNDPKKCLLVGSSTTNTTTSHYIRSNSSTTGVVYMPNAYISVTSNNQAINGALSAKNIRFSSVAALHYDTTLRTAGKIGTYIDGPYMITELRELTDPTDRVTLP